MLSSASEHIRKAEFRTLSSAERLFVRQCVAHTAADYREKALLAAAALDQAGPMPVGMPKAAMRLREDLVAIERAYREAADFAERVAAGEVGLSRRTNRRASILERNIAAAKDRLAGTTLRSVLADLDLSFIKAAGSA